MQLTQEQEKKLKRIAKLVDFDTKGAVVLIEDIFALEDKIPELSELVEELKKERPDRDEIKEIISELIATIKIPEAINGDKGDKGDCYELTEDDKKEIASFIDVPVVEKIIEKHTETIKVEQPIIKEVAVIDKTDLTKEGEAIRDGLELLPEGDKLKIEAIEDLRKELDELKKTGGTHNVVSTNRALYQLLDVNVSGITTNQSIKWNGTQWVAYTPTDLDNQNLQSVTDIGATTTNPITTGGLTTPYVQFDTTATPITNAEGLLQWNATDGTLDLGMDNGDITMQVGQEMFTKVRNQSGSTITNGKAVYFSGRLGNRPLISLAKSDAESTSRVAGITTQDIISPDDGFITTVGYVRGIKTDYTGAGIWGTTWVTGDLLYVSKTDAGVLTNVEPASPHHSDIVGTVGIVHSSLGSILVEPERHKTLAELSDVNGTALTTTGQIPVWNNTAGYFDFTSNIANYVPYTGATSNVNLGAYTLTASALGYMSGKRTGAILVNLPSGFDDSNLSSDGTNINTLGKLSIGTTSTSAKVNIESTTEQLRISYSAINYYTTTVSSVGLVTFDATGVGAGFRFNDSVSIISSSPGLLMEAGANAVNAGTITFRTTGGSESFAQTFNASDNNFYFKYGATTVGSVTGTGWGFGVTAFDNSATVDIRSTTEQFRSGYDASNYWTATTGSTGITTFNAVSGSGNSRFVFSDVVQVDYIWNIAGANQIDVGISQLLNNGSVTVDWANKQLVDTSTVIASWSSAGFSATNFLSAYLLTSAGYQSVNVDARQLIDPYNVSKFEWGSTPTFTAGFQSNNGYAYFTSTSGTYYGYLMNGKAGEFNDNASNVFRFCDSTYASEGVGLSWFHSTGSGASAKFGGSIGGEFDTNGGYSVSVKLADNNTGYAGYFDDGTDHLILMDGYNAISAVSMSGFGGGIEVKDLYDYAGMLDTNSSYCVEGYLSRYGGSARSGAGRFYDGTRDVVLANGSYAINATGDIYVTNGASSGTGYTGDLKDSTSTKIADVVSGIITALYF